MGLLFILCFVKVGVLSENDFADVDVNVNMVLSISSQQTVVYIH